MEKILLVEDDKSLSMGLVYSFNKEGYKIDHAESVAEAKKYLEDMDYDLLVLDVGLPDGDGYELCAYVREFSEVPVIFLTARDDEEDLIKGFDFGADDYMTKPFSLKELMVRVKSILKRSAKKQVSLEKTSGDIRVDVAAAKAYKKDQVLDLTPSEYKLLNYFMDNKKIALSRNQILEHLWDAEGDFIGDNTISVYISRLREKIEDDLSDPIYIVTVRGIGYRWDQEVN